ncbi:MAG TPA: hypothetical protein VGY49_01465 [Burkholderiaceae bacterium]|nr:hypothetical protein [Burkholderiaceae bacterium]
MNTQDLAYALTQVVHNFGAVAVTAGAAGGRWTQAATEPKRQRRLQWLVLGGWVAQILSGATFGGISYASFGQFPEIHGIAVAALRLKITCAVAGVSVSTLLLARARAWNETQRSHAWSALLGFAAIALCAAAFLRWFS